jgi:hypothetical protein
MAYRDINDYLKSGKVETIVVAENIIYKKAEQAEGMFMKIGKGGATSLYKAVNRDKEWVAEDTTDYQLTAGLTEVLSMTVDMDILTTDGSYKLAFLATNTNADAQNMLVKVYDDGVQIGDMIVISVAGGASHQLYVLSGELKNDVDSGSNITVNFGGNSNIVLNGTATPTSFTLVKAEAIPVT